jgi:hypothetical protein
MNNNAYKLYWEVKHEKINSLTSAGGYVHGWL